MDAFLIEIDGGAPPARPFALMREKVVPALGARRGGLEAMCAPVMGRPEADPVPLTAVTVLQMMRRLPDRACAGARLYGARWRLALDSSPAFHPATLARFRARLARHGGARLALGAALAAMRGEGLVRSRAVRTDSTHLLARVSDMSRLECVRETLRLAPGLLSAFGGGESREPWLSRHAERDPGELRDAPANTLAARMGAAGADTRDVLARADALGPAVAAAVPAATLRRVPGEQFGERGDAAPAQRRAPLPGAAASPHDPDARWSARKTLGKEGWKGCKAHACETVHDAPRLKGEPTRSAITAIRVVPATASDHGAATPVLALHAATAGDAAPPAEALADAGHISAPALLAAAACGLRDRCLPKKGAPARRSVEAGEHHMIAQARRDLCKTEEYRIRMRRRDAIEGTHSELARGCGFRRRRYRGTPKTRLQAHLTAVACNISRRARRACWEGRQNG